MNKLGISLLSGIIFLAITITAIAIVLQAGVPVIQKIQASASIEKMKSTFTELDNIIREVASEGKGSKRTVFLRVEPGKLVVDDSADTVYWTFDTEAAIISPRTSQKFGNLIVGANLDTTASEGNYSGTDSFILENEHLRVYIKKLGSPSNFTSYNTSDLLLAVYQNDTDSWLSNSGFFDISLDNEPDSKTGNGYTSLLDSGENLPFATVVAYMNSSHTPYFINFTLESGTDFLEIEVSLA